MKKIFITAFCFFFLQGIILAESIEILGGKKQTGIIGRKSEEPLSVKVLTAKGRPAAGVTVFFSIVQEPGQPYGKGTRAALSVSKAVTGKDGVATSEIIFGMPKQGTHVVTASTEKTMLKPVYFELTSLKPNWMIFLILGLLGGLGVFLFGMFYLNDSLQKVAGKKLRNLCHRVS